MHSFNSVSTAVFDLLLAPFGGSADWHVAVSLLFWSVAFGMLALLAFKYCSHQAAIARTKNLIKVHLLEIRLFQDDLLGVVAATGKILLRNALYIGHNLLPMVVMAAPMIALLAQIEARYAFAPVPPGSVVLLKAQLDRSVTTEPATEVSLELPPGVVLDAPPVRTAQGEAVWRLRAEGEGDHVLRLRVGADGPVIEKGLFVGGEPRKVPVLRTKGWEALLYPGEAVMPSDSPFESIALSSFRPAEQTGRPAGAAPRGYPERQLDYLPDGELGVMVTFLVISIAAGFALKGVFKVTF
ncbi:MAG: hypothetical protein ACT4PU_00025 [Planctomycetota bacterium]